MSTRTTRFPEVTHQEAKRLPCPSCGVKIRRQRMFTMTLSPFNKNADGTVRDVPDCVAALQVVASEWAERPEMCTPCLDTGEPVAHPTSARMVVGDASTYLSVSTTPHGTMLGSRWPCRLLEVQPVGEVIAPDVERMPYLRGVLAVRVVRELPAWLVLGPNGKRVAAIIDRAATLTQDEVDALAAARTAAWAHARTAAWFDSWFDARTAASTAARDEARYAARYDAWDAVQTHGLADALDAALAAARTAVRHAARATVRQYVWDSALEYAVEAARDAVYAEMVADHLTSDQYTALAGPWRSVIGDQHV